MKQKIYNCMLRFKGAILHQLPVNGATMAELKLLAFMHGDGAIADLKFVGMQEVYFPKGEAEEKPRLVESEMDEYKRLALKYEHIVNPGRGRKAVETCFSVRLEDFDAMVAEVDARDAVAQAAEAAEAKAAITEGDEVRKKIEAEKQPPIIPPIGERVFKQPQQRPEM